MLLVLVLNSLEMLELLLLVSLELLVLLDLHRDGAVGSPSFSSTNSHKPWVWVLEAMNGVPHVLYVAPCALVAVESVLYEAMKCCAMEAFEGCAVC